MGVADYLASLNLSPEATQKLIGPVDRAPGPPPPPPPEAPAPASAGKGFFDGIIDRAFKGPDTALATDTSGKAIIGPDGKPQVVTTRTADGKRADVGPTGFVPVGPGGQPELKDPKAAEAKASPDSTPQGPAGSDGFPTYRDPSQDVTPGGAPTGPMRVVPAHWQPGSRSFAAQFGMNPEELQDGQYHRDAAAGQRFLAADKRLDAAQQQAEADVAYADSHARATEIAAAKNARLAQEREAYVLREREKMEELSQAAQAKVDPELAKGPGGAQVLSAIAIGLGQFGASLTGGSNTALQIVQSNIDRRIAAQQANITNAASALKNQQSLYAQNLAVFGDKERAILATKAAYLDQAKAMAEQTYARTKGISNEAQYNELVAGLQDRKAEVADNFAKLTHTQRTEQGNEHYVPTQVVGGSGAGQKGKDELYVPSLGGYARDGETAKKLNAHAAQRMSINEDLHEIDSLLAESKGLSSATDYGRMQEIRTRVNALKNGVLQKTTVLAEQGAMSKGDQGVAEARSSLESIDPFLKTDGAIDRQRKALKQVAVGHQRDHRLEGEAVGIQTGREAWRQGPTGPEAVRVNAGRTRQPSKTTESYDDLVEKPKGKSDR